MGLKSMERDMFTAYMEMKLKSDQNGIEIYHNKKKKLYNVFVLKSDQNGIEILVWGYSS